MTTALKLSGVTLPGSGYPKKKHFVVPVLPHATGLLGLYVFGNTLAFSMINHANSALPLLQSGSPVVSDLGIVFTPRANYFDTQIPSQSAMTIYAVSKTIKAAASANSSMLVSNYTSTGGNTGDALAFDAVNQARAYVGLSGPTVANSALSVAAAPNTTDYNTMVARIKSTGEAKIFRSESGVVATGAETAAGTRNVMSRNLLIGSNYSVSSFGATCDIQMVAIFNNAQSDAEITANLAYLNQTYGPAVGLTTL